MEEGQCVGLYLYVEGDVQRSLSQQANNTLNQAGEQTLSSLMDSEDSYPKEGDESTKWTKAEKNGSRVWQPKIEYHSRCFDQ